MPEFEVDYHRKVTLWKSTKFDITADTREQAIAKAIELVDDPECEEHVYDDPYNATYDDIDDTEEGLSPDENKGMVTEELFLAAIDEPIDYEKPIWRNV